MDCEIHPGRAEEPWEEEKTKQEHSESVVYKK